ncbi:hypothetical protein [Pedobacter gandavensis]|uniref:hypothetical protein n=1 Tax=Pedobacter gandavensis TaxID=2679963 RepID=UPI0029314345|nr:hypothetical protein [Pedobacter gandavensis]
MKEEAPKHDKSIFEISYAKAKKITTAWDKQGHFIKGYLVDAQELRDMVDQEGVSYVRMYFGWDDQMEEGRQQRMIMVPTDKYGSDLIPEGAKTENSEEESNIFDFTMPCPPTCSPTPGL